ncbi:hypothetical protein A6B43_01690 [Vespertiliibacter pulmonis]|uniref:Arginase n=1 Tax=Vespertiliibacter pulmonis TaxID=1443036 RepID=A0A3N4VTG5_9PAST|nr:arginase [Vespertiliibacter pulmonis]QLB20342.1 hypothetical protein A6B43_01690 [Vespertiliibacter pulmonis]RPE86328.1 arginase [Vespertiliibacter pulmonis]
MRSLQFINILSDIGAGKLGARQGVQQLWEKARVIYPHQRCTELSIDTVPTVYHNVKNEAKHIDKLTSFFQHQVVPSLTKLFQFPEFPIILSGDHSNAIGTLSALCNAYPNKRIGVLWIDAHSDLHTPYTTPSGNVHGMSLAAVSRQDNLLSSVRIPTSTIIEQWCKLKMLAPTSSGIRPEDIFFLGLRSYEEPELNLIEQFNIPYISAIQTRELGFKRVLNSIKHHFEAVDLLYVSFDVDALDASLIPTTGTPEPDGFTYAEIKEILDAVLTLPQLAVFEITEFNPTLVTNENYLTSIYTLLSYAIEKIQQKV